MNPNSADFDGIVQETARSLRNGNPDLLRTLDDLAVPIYVTDAEGVITYYNRACIPFAGRTPTAGSDAWCVTWKLYTADGHNLAHDQCPMAVAIREGRHIRDQEAIAERPDGSFVSFVPYPTPLFADDGSLIGALNMLVDVTDRKRAELLQRKAANCRRLADASSDPEAAATIEAIALYYEEQEQAMARAH